LTRKKILSSSRGNCSGTIGVVGIVASRVLQEFYRPTIIIGGENGEMRGSGRSIAGFDLASALRECDEFSGSPRRTRDGGG